MELIWPLTFIIKRYRNIPFDIQNYPVAEFGKYRWFFFFALLDVVEEPICHGWHSLPQRYACALTKSPVDQSISNSCIYQTIYEIKAWLVAVGSMVSNAKQHINGIPSDVYVFSHAQIPSFIWAETIQNSGVRIHRRTFHMRISYFPDSKASRLYIIATKSNCVKFQLVDGMYGNGAKTCLWGEANFNQSASARLRPWTLRWRIQCSTHILLMLMLLWRAKIIGYTHLIMTPHQNW